MDHLLDATTDELFGILMPVVGPESPYRGVILAVSTLIVLLYFYRATRRRLEAYIGRNALNPRNLTTFLRAYDAVWKVSIAIVFLIAASGSLALLGLSVAFVGTVLGWSLQVPIRGMAAWFMVMLKRPFRVGDRIAVAGVVGDVVEIQLNHILLNQVGGTVVGEEKSGRGIFVPNAMLFDHNVINYNYFAAQGTEHETGVSQYMLDEVLVRLTFGSDLEFAKSICKDAARQAVGELLGDVDVEPFIRTEFLAWGLLLRVRFKTTPARRQEVTSRVTELIWMAFRGNPDRITFGFPVSIADMQGGPGPKFPTGGGVPRPAPAR